jgi:hypothetical protein
VGRAADPPRAARPSIAEAGRPGPSFLVGVSALPQRCASTAAAAADGSPPARRGHVSALGWDAPHELEYNRWVLEGRRIGVMSRGSPWWIGDWLLYGTARWGERYVAAAKITGYDTKTLRNMRYVASRFDVSLRKDNLTWSHHALLAGLDRVSQRSWLARAVSERMSVEDLRIELRAERRHGVREPTDARMLAAGTGATRPGDSTVTCPRCGDRIPVAPALRAASARVPGVRCART